jgi:hypothetical protein
LHTTFFKTFYATSFNDDGKVTRADILKGRGVEGFKKGGMQSGGTVDEDGRVMDQQTMKNQKAYEGYEREQSDAQRKLEERDKSMIEGARKVKEKIKKVMPFKKGGSVSSASKRADGIAIRGKTRA